jgi:hypothetical protein
MAKRMLSEREGAGEVTEVWDYPLLHIVFFCEGPNEKPEGFTKQKQSAIFGM